MYAVYILLCADNSYYTGLTNDLEKRLWQHETGFFPTCYTNSRRPVKLAWQTIIETSEEANRMERQIKGWSRKKKEALIANDIDELKKLSNEKKADTERPLRQAQGQVDYLLIGQGICGTWLSYYLQKQNKSFLVIDNNNENSPSKIAAGIINPVTGRRIVETWMIDELLPFAWEAYSEIGYILDISAISQKTIIDFFPSPQMLDAFRKRLEEGCRYLHAFPEQNHFNHLFNYDFGCGEIKPVYTAHTERLLPAWRKYLENADLLLEEDFDSSQLIIDNETVRYKDVIAEKIIFCDGSAGVDNPYFKQLPFAPNKGEALTLRIPDLPDHHIYKKGMLLAPLTEKNIFWIGSSYEWEFNDPGPTKKFRDTTEAFLKSWLKIPFEILEHKAAIRPATLERRPFIGFHPLHKNVGILNGMGTKGCSLAPFFAKQLADYLIFDSPIQKDADVRRFQKVLLRRLD
ncbi:MAG: FAD-dependent oxidoreductase [Chitinophagaceae bacterium]